MEKDKRLMDASWWERWGKRSCSGGVGRASKHLNQFSVEWQGCAPSLLFDLRPNCGGGDEDNDDLLEKVPSRQCSTLCPQPLSRALPSHASSGDSWTLTGKSGPGSCGVPASSSGSWRSRGSVSLRSLFRSPLYVLEALWWVKGDLLREGFCHAQLHCTQTPCPCGRPLLTRTSPEDTQTHKMDYYSVLKWRNF